MFRTDATPEEDSHQAFIFDVAVDGDTVYVSGGFEGVSQVGEYANGQPGPVLVSRGAEDAVLLRFAAVDGQPEAAQRMGGAGSNFWCGLEAQNGLVYATGMGLSSWEADYATGTLDHPDSAFVQNTVPCDLLTMKLNAAAPIVSITSPPNAFLVEPGTPITFQGTTGGNPISWNSSIDGPLGQGNTLTVSLSPGVHLITASSTNGLGLTGLTGTRVRALPEVTIQASDPAAAEQGNDTGQFTVTRSNGYGALTVKYSVGGTAAADDYFEMLSGSLAFANGELSKTILVTPVDDGLGEGSETIVLTLQSDHAPPEHPQTYLIGSPDSATVTIADNDQAPVADRAVSERTVSGTIISGTLVATRASDDVYEAIREVQTGGKTSSRKSLLDHRWTFNVTGGQTATFSVEAYHTSNTEGDNSCRLSPEGACLVFGDAAPLVAPQHPNGGCLVFPRRRGLEPIQKPIWQTGESRQFSAGAASQKQVFG
jgi:hypothetical protein